MSPLRRGLSLLLCLTILVAGLLTAVLPLQAAAAVLPASAAVTVSVDTWNRFKITWTAVPGAQRYWLQRKADDGTAFDTLAYIDAPATSHYDIVQNGHLYTYRVRAISGSDAGLSADAQPACMLWPTGISVLPVSASSMEVSWTLPANPWLPASGYIPVLERRLAGGAWTAAGRATAGAAAFTDAGLLEGQKYEYRVRFDVGLSGTALWWPTGDGSAGWTKLQAPTALTAKLTAYGTVDLAWKTAATQAAYTQVERSTDGGTFTLLTTLAAGTLSFADSAVANGHVYRYRVRHMNAGATGDWSAESRIVFLYPAAMTAQAAFPDQINLTWTWPPVDPAVLGEARPRLERRKAGESAWSLAALLEAGVTEYRDQGLAADTVYNYRIQAQYQDGSVSPYYPAYGQGLEVRTGIAFNVGFTGHALSTTMVRLEWDFEALSGRTVRLERYDAAGVPQPLLTTASEGSYIDTGLLPGSEYAWRLVILAPSGYSTAASDPLTIKTEAAPTPANVKAAPAAEDRVVITWDYAYAQESGFEIWRKAGGTWTKVGETERNVQYWTDTALPASGTAQWKVRAVRGETVYSAFAATDVRRLDKPVLPDAFEGQLNLGRLKLAWASPLPDWGGDAVYTLETRTGVNDAWVDVIAIPAASRSIEWFLMQHGTRDFRIRADVQGLPIYSGIYRFTGAQPAAPQNLHVAYVGSRQVAIAWNAPAESLSGYRVYRTEGGVRRQLATLSGTAIRYDDTTVTAGAAPSYALVAWNAYTTSPESTVGPVSVPAVTAFTDLAGYTWAAPSINRLASLGIVAGTSAARFSPGRVLSRAEYMKMLLTALGIPAASRPSGPVSDIPASAWYAGWMYAAWEYGLITPDASGRLYPNAAITRGGMALATQNACLAAGKTLVAADESILEKYEDADAIPGQYRGALVVLIGNGLLSGRSGTTIAATSGLTRAEAAVMLNRLLLLP